VSSPPGFWYDQDRDEWILVIKGTAELQFADGKSVTMNAGDYLLIPKHEKHRVEHTSEEVVWLAVHVMST
jgi:cupin 2 domain-containing protein